MSDVLGPGDAAGGDAGAPHRAPGQVVTCTYDGKVTRPRHKGSGEDATGTRRAEVMPYAYSNSHSGSSTKPGE